MKKLSINLCIILSMIVSFAVSAKASKINKADTAGIKAALHQVNLSYGQAFVKSDSSLFINCYTPDACLLPTNSPALCGVQGQLGFYRFAYKAGVRNIVFTTLNLYGATDLYVSEEGNFEMFGVNNVSLGKGKYLVVWKKTADGWRMYRDMFNSNSAPKR
jgi:ketosteroid isomerase-like protein